MKNTTNLVPGSSLLPAELIDEVTPYLCIDPSVVAESTRSIRAALPEIALFYALKANSHPAVVTVLASMGVGFEIASAAELEQVLAAGIPAARILCLHPIKSPEFLRRLKMAGVKMLAMDCAEEVAQIALFAPGSSVLARLSITDTGSRVPLENKFGCTPEQAVSLLALSKNLGLHPAGLTLHVGSQCDSSKTWVRALMLCREVADELTRLGMSPEWVSLGGGLPANYSGSGSGVSEIASAMRQSGLSELVRGPQLSLEPGRALVAEAGTLVASVMGVAERNGERWVYLDAGIYHGLFEMLPVAGGLQIPVIALVKGRRERLQRLAGPTCDSLDTLPQPRLLPELHVGDRVAFGLAGAYSTEMATRFNGFSSPTIRLVNNFSCKSMQSTPNPYINSFSPRQYLQQFYSLPELAADDAELFRVFSRWLASQARTFERVLDLGCGPTLHNSFALAPYANSIELADFLPPNLEEIRLWLVEEAGAHNWDALLTGVLGCQGLPPTALESRKALYRSRVSKLQHCDLRRESPLEGLRSFDLVTSFFCSECITSSKSEWIEIMRRVAGLVSPGGALFMAAIGKASRYNVLGQWFDTVRIDEADLAHVLGNLGFGRESIQTWSVPAPDWIEDGFDHILLVGATNRSKGVVQ